MMDTDTRKSQVIEKGGVKIPKLDLTSIYIQREVSSSQNDNDDSNSDDDDVEEEDSYYNE